jgi:hypothetical protein
MVSGNLVGSQGFASHIVVLYYNKYNFNSFYSLRMLTYTTVLNPTDIYITCDLYNVNSRYKDDLSCGMLLNIDVLPLS